ncbi:hypothetical protein LCGC14_0920750 [marine sediment metagenome]|uniref:Uncharacterized protein n=1 Tax=marine sediment metagenome TaxID=412755 RepID=A0A0F9NVP5_9ZZZZ
MPTVLGKRFGPDFRGRPPHMAPIDEVIWRRWRPALPKGLMALYFDVGLGLPRELPGPTTPEALMMWIRINQKRLDVLIEWPTEIWIVELRHAASLNAVGRLLGYRMLWRDDPVIQKPVELLIVTDRFDADVEQLAIAQGLGYLAV